MANISIHRENCVDGYWGYPDGLIGPAWLTAMEMAAQYISIHAGRDFRGDELASFGFEFTPDIPEDYDGHGVPGTVHIVYEFK